MFLYKVSFTCAALVVNTRSAYGFILSNKHTYIIYLLSPFVLYSILMKQPYK